MIEVVAGKRAPVAMVVPIRGAGRVTGHLARYIIKIGGRGGIFQILELIL